MVKCEIYHMMDQRWIRYQILTRNILNSNEMQLDPAMNGQMNRYWLKQRLFEAKSKEARQKDWGPLSTLTTYLIEIIGLTEINLKSLRKIDKGRPKFSRGHPLIAANCSGDGEWWEGSTIKIPTIHIPHFHKSLFSDSMLLLTISSSLSHLGSSIFSFI